MLLHASAAGELVKLQAICSSLADPVRLLGHRVSSRPLLSQTPTIERSSQTAETSIPVRCRAKMAVAVHDRKQGRRRGLEPSGSATTEQTLQWQRTDATHRFCWERKARLGLIAPKKALSKSHMELHAATHAVTRIHVWSRMHLTSQLCLIPACTGPMPKPNQPKPPNYKWKNMENPSSV